MDAKAKKDKEVAEKMQKEEIENFMKMQEVKFGNYLENKAFKIPHPLKVQKGGEDASMILPK